MFAASDEQWSAAILRMGSVVGRRRSASSDEFVPFGENDQRAHREAGIDVLT
jgi:hypothetical protein